jgi:hypothetical protein
MIQRLVSAALFAAFGVLSMSSAHAADAVADFSSRAKP